MAHAHGVTAQLPYESADIKRLCPRAEAAVERLRAGSAARNALVAASEDPSRDAMRLEGAVEACAAAGLRAVAAAVPVSRRSAIAAGLR